MKIFDMKVADAKLSGSSVLALSSDLAGPVRGRRSWSVEEKLKIIAEVESSGDPVAVVARRHGMNANHLFHWIRGAKQGTLGRRSSARRLGADEPPPEFIDLGVFTREQIEQAVVGDCVMEIDLPGGIRMRVPSAIDAEALTRAVRALRAAS